MKNGIYETILNKEMKEILNNGDYFVNDLSKKISTYEYQKLIVEYLREVTDKALNRITELDNDINDEVLLVKEIKIANQIIDVLRNNLSFDELKNLDISESCEILEYAYRKIDCNSLNNKSVIRPLTSLVESSLFTNSSKEISLLTELTNEIKSCDEVCFLVSFIKVSGINPLITSIQEASDNGKKIRILTTTYMQATDQKAIQRLCKIKNVEIKISYNTTNTRLHAKSYIFKRNSGFSTFYIGSSNISHSALNSGCEWNVKLTQKKSTDIYNNIVAQFETYWNSNEFETFDNSDKANEKLASALNKTNINNINHRIEFELKPYDYQLEILEKINAERTIFHQHKNLIVAATGVGKTVIAAFDFKHFLSTNPNAKLLFIAHREEILTKSMDTFRIICQDLNFGEIYNGRNIPHSKDRLFASVDAANKLINKHGISPCYYDYIIIDEFHHAKAKTYDSILKMYKPKELLGLTATPDRRDGKNILDYFDGNIAAEIGLQEAIDKHLLSPFQYFGITDSVDLSNIKWNRGGYDEEELSNILSNGNNADMRSKLIIDKVLEYSNDMDNVRGIGFCVSIQHADYMAKQFNNYGISSLAVTSKTNNNLKDNAIKNLMKGKYKFLFTVDLYNEGVDIPCINIELMLRPTDSQTIFLQQLGRGLRLFDGKDCLTVLDFIGEANKKFKYENKIKSLVGKSNYSCLKTVELNFPNLPSGCSVTLEKVAKKKILDNIKKHKTDKKLILDLLKSFEEDTGLKLTLANFLNFYKISLKQFYSINDFNFYRACKACGIDDLYDKENDIETLFGNHIKGLINIDSPLLISYISDIIKNKKSQNNIMNNLLYYSLFNDLPKKLLFSDTNDAIDCLLSSNIIKYEVSQIVDVLYKNIEIVPKKNNINKDVPLEVYCTYSRNQIFAAFNIHDSNHHQSIREGVKYIKDLDHDVLLVTLKKDSKSFTNTTSYNDYAISSSLFHWQTQSKIANDSNTMNRYINSNGRVSMFVRVTKDDPYIYLGECDYLSHEGSKPVNVIWKLKNNIPAKYIGDVNNLI